MKTYLILIDLLLSLPIYACDGQKIHIKNNTQSSRQVVIGFVEVGVYKRTKIKLDQHPLQITVYLPAQSTIHDFNVFNSGKDEYSGIEYISPTVQEYKNHRFYIYRDPGSTDVKITHDIFND